jgi:hypothetical protein
MRSAICASAVGLALLEPFAQAELVAIPDIAFVEFLPLVVAHHVAVHHLPAPEVVDRIEHLQRAAVALLLHLGDPPRVLVDGAQLGGHETCSAVSSLALAGSRRLLM